MNVLSQSLLLKQEALLIVSKLFSKIISFSEDKFVSIDIICKFSYYGEHR